jgi:hypothetical protein
MMITKIYYREKRPEEYSSNLDFACQPFPARKALLLEIAVRRSNQFLLAEVLEVADVTLFTIYGG